MTSGSISVDFPIWAEVVGERVRCVYLDLGLFSAYCTLIEPATSAFLGSLTILSPLE